LNTGQLKHYYLIVQSAKSGFKVTAVSYTRTVAVVVNGNMTNIGFIKLRSLTTNDMEKVEKLLEELNKQIELLRMETRNETPPAVYIIIFVFLAWFVWAVTF